VIPRGVRFNNGSAFPAVQSSSFSIENGNERFGLLDDFLIDIIDHKLIRHFPSSTSAIIPCDIEILAPS
jgi:hypothetical protein